MKVFHNLFDIWDSILQRSRVVETVNIDFQSGTFTAMFVDCHKLKHPAIEGNLEKQPFSIGMINYKMVGNTLCSVSNPG